ncbi:hypothetical protein EGW08_018503 [Elysia chlorotica]|uniref:G-protein coupled receptors family 1 profile domain-containing protein n=1 Tax=Elysia chlorotica TaxID=188477 RepID=A0A3S1B1B0_ELYCH|nr:hypothetical protein EGW08_018503 [Elysia chlorotica]
MPFKVKALVTPPITASFMAGLSLVVFGSFSPMFSIYTIGYTFSPFYNASIVTVTPGANYFAMDGLILKLYKFLGIFYPAVFCAIMISTSTIIVFHLRNSKEKLDNMKGAKSAKSAKSAQASAAATVTAGQPSLSSATLTRREVKVTKMLLVVILVYLMDFFPRLVKYSASLVEPEFFMYKRYHNLMMVMSNVMWILDFLNASVNFFIFLGMSTNFNKTFYTIFPRCSKHEKDKHSGKERGSKTNDKTTLQVSEIEMKK